MRVVGVDGSEGGWTTVVLEDGAFAEMPRELARFEDVVAAFATAARIAVDIPIGLPPPYPRRADIEAKRFVGPERQPSIFLMPVRTALKAPTQRAASAINQRATGQGVSRQAVDVLDAAVAAWDRVPGRSRKGAHAARPTRLPANPASGGD